MKIRRAIGFSVLAYIISMIVGMIMSMVAGLDMTTMANPPLWLCAISIGVAVLVCWKGAWLYFRGKNVARGTVEGLKFGIVLILTGFVLDVLIWGLAYPGVGGFMDSMNLLMDYYKQPYFWATFILILIVSTLTGKYMAKKRG